MFTGIIQTTGRIRSRSITGEAGKLTIETSQPVQNPVYGESIAVNGTCLTLEAFSGNLLSFHVMAESFRRTNLGELPLGGIVNLERAMAAGDRFGGHIVSGHVDAAGTILSCGKAGSDTEYVIELPECIRDFLAPKGSICVDGISLTLAGLEEDRFSVRIIPVTWKETALQFRKQGDKVNLEADLIGKYVHHQLRHFFGKEEKKARREISMNDLLEAGF